jgi:hypothetical protein
VSRTPFGWLNRALLGWAQPKVNPESVLLTKHDLLLVGSGFTPDDLGASDPVVGDRPYGSHLGLSSRRVVVPIRKKKQTPGEPAGALEDYPTAIRTEVVLGILGSGVPAAIQTWIHENNDSVDPKGWHNEISDGGEPTLLLRAQYDRRLVGCWIGGCGQPELYGRRFLELTAFGEGMAGYYTNLAGGVRGRFGWFQSEFWDFDGAPLGSVAQAAGVPKEASINRLEFFFFGGLQARVVAWNALLQGQFKENPYEIPSADVERVLGEFQAGVVASIPIGKTWRVGLGYLYAGRSAEFAGPMARAHTYGSAFLTITRVPDIAN